MNKAVKSMPLEERVAQRIESSVQNASPVIKALLEQSPKQRRVLTIYLNSPEEREELAEGVRDTYEAMITRCLVEQIGVSVKVSHHFTSPYCNQVFFIVTPTQQ